MRVGGCARREGRLKDKGGKAKEGRVQAARKVTHRAERKEQRTSRIKSKEGRRTRLRLQLHRGRLSDKG